MTRQELKSPLKEEIEDLDDRSNEAWSDGNYVESIQLMLEAWEKLPDPKGEYSESYHLCDGLVSTYLLIENYADAKKWSQEIYQCGLHRIDSGERELLSGKVAFAMNDLESAKKFFTIANKKSSGRLFQNEEKKYKNLLDKADIVPTKFKDLYKMSLKEFEKGDFSYALNLAYDCLNLKQADADVHLLKGKCHFELKEMDHAADSFTRAYMLSGFKIFKKDDPKYLNFLKTKIELK